MDKVNGKKITGKINKKNLLKILIMEKVRLL